MDTIRGVPALADTDSLASVGQYSRDLRTALLGTTAAITAASGWAYGDPAPVLERQGNVISLSGRVQPNGAITIGTGFTNVANFTAWRPPRQLATVTTTNVGFVELVITTGGAVSIRLRSGSLALATGDYVHLDRVWFI